jgi:hypothetical protein
VQKEAVTTQPSNVILNIQTDLDGLINEPLLTETTTETVTATTTSTTFLVPKTTFFATPLPNFRTTATTTITTTTTATTSGVTTTETESSTADTEPPNTEPNVEIESGGSSPNSESSLNEPPTSMQDDLNTVDNDVQATSTITSLSEETTQSEFLEETTLVPNLSEFKAHVDDVFEFQVMLQMLLNQSVLLNLTFLLNRLIKIKSLN